MTREVKCFYCGKEGHIKTDCRSFAKDKLNGTTHPDRYRKTTQDPSTPKGKTTAIRNITTNDDDQHTFEEVTTMETTSRSPKITIELRSQHPEHATKYTTDALIDTGATITCISQAIVHTMGATNTIDKNKALEFNTAIGRYKSLGSIKLTVYHEDLAIPLVAQVVSNLSNTLIIGYDTLRKLSAIVHTGEDSLRFRIGNTWRNLPLRTNERTFEQPAAFSIQTDINPTFKHGQLD